MLIPLVLATALLPHLAAAAAANTSCPSAYGLQLPSTFPTPAQGYNCTIPSHFALFGYSYDGTIINQPYFTNGKPYNITAGTTVAGSDGYGSYSFGIGPAGHVFAMNDGRVGFMSLNLRPNSSDEITYFFFDSWSDYWGINNAKFRGDKPVDPIPTCEIASYWNVLQCSLNGTSLDFGYCGPDVKASESGWGPNTVVWGTNVTKECTKVVLRVEQVSQNYGHSIPGPYCLDHPTTIGCHGASNSTAA